MAAEVTRLDIGFEGGQVLAVRVADAGLRGAAQGARQREGRALARAEARRTPRSHARPLAGRLRAARHRRAPRRVLACARAPRARPRAAAPAAHARPHAGGRAGGARASRARGEHGLRLARAGRARARLLDRGARGRSTGARWARCSAGDARQHGGQVQRSAAARPVLEELPPLVGHDLRAAPTPRRTPPPRSRRRACCRRRCRRAPLYALAGAMALSRALPRRALPLATRVAGALLGDAAARLAPRAVKVGIVGLPNAGKSSLFNALTRAGARPPTTRSPRSSRTWPWCRCRTSGSSGWPTTVGATPVVPETIEFHDIAGPGARRAPGRGPRQPVPRQHPRDRRAPARGAGARRRRRWCTPRGGSTRSPTSRRVETELLYADLEQAERRLERVAQAGQVARQGDGGRGALAAGGGGGAGRGPGRALGAGARRRARRAAAAAPPLTAKPVLYVANVAEGEPLEPPPRCGARRARGAARRR